MISVGTASGNSRAYLRLVACVALLVAATTIAPAVGSQAQFYADPECQDYLGLVAFGNNVCAGGTYNNLDISVSGTCTGNFSTAEFFPSASSCGGSGGQTYTNMPFICVGPFSFPGATAYVFVSVYCSH